MTDQFDDNEDYDDNYDLAEGMEEYNDNPASDLPWGMMALIGLGGLVVYQLIKKGGQAGVAAATAGVNALPAQVCERISPTQLPEYVDKGWQIYPISNSSSGGVLWACPPGVNPPGA